MHRANGTVEPPMDIIGAELLERCVLFSEVAFEKVSWSS